jgi:uncharacterized protein (DUF362 family)/Pyruvate/2-oxoacid:ferredoxin oxidoreductase delta subunit
MHQRFIQHPSPIFNTSKTFKKHLFNMNPKVSILKCTGYGYEEVYKAVKVATDLLGGIGKFVKKGERILVKPNLLSSKPTEAAVTTHPSVVKAVIMLVKQAGAVPVVGDSPGIGSGSKVAEKCGVMDVCKETGTQFMDLKTPVLVENPNGRTFKRLEVAKEALKVDGIINLPKLKTHAQMFLTLGVKNIFGCVPGKLKAQLHLSAGVDTDFFAGMILDLYLFLRPRLTVMDGIVAMEGNGPGSGDPKALGLLFASRDAVAMDRVVTEVLGARCDDSPVLGRARVIGLLGAELERIEVVGEEVRNVRVRGFRFPPLVSTNFTANLPSFIDRRIRRTLTSRPYITTKKCTVCSVCVDVCPAGVMDKGTQIMIDYDNCIRCFCCQEICPEMAISVKEGWLKKVLAHLSW